jgi:hypothetical protein
MSKNSKNSNNLNEVETVVILRNPRISTSGSPPPVEKIESSPMVTERIENILEQVKKNNDKYLVSFTEKHRNFFVESKDRIFSTRTDFNKAIARFNTSFASELKIYNPRTKDEFEDFIKDTPHRVLSVPIGECAVILGGAWVNDEKKTERIIHSVMVYNKKGKYLIFNPNDNPGTYDDGFYECYPIDNKVFDRPLRSRIHDLHIGITGGACFVISYALKILCETMPFVQFMKLVKTKSLREIMEKCFEVMEG